MAGTCQNPSDWWNLVTPYTVIMTTHPLWIKGTILRVMGEKSEFF